MRRVLRFNRRNKIKNPKIINPDRVASGWENVVEKTIESMLLNKDSISLVDIGCSDGRKGSRRYVNEYNLDPRNITGIEVQDKHIKTWKEFLPTSPIHKLDFIKNPISELDIGKFNVALLCEVLEHIEKTSQQIDLLHNVINLITTGGGLHITFPKTTLLSCPIKEPFGHKCKEVAIKDIIAFLDLHFDDVSSGQAKNHITFQIFALRKK